MQNSQCNVQHISSASNNAVSVIHLHHKICLHFYTPTACHTYSTVGTAGRSLHGNPKANQSLEDQTWNECLWHCNDYSNWKIMGVGVGKGGEWLFGWYPSCRGWAIPSCFSLFQAKTQSHFICSPIQWWPLYPWIPRGQEAMGLPMTRDAKHASQNSAHQFPKTPACFIGLKAYNSSSAVGYVPWGEPSQDSGIWSWVTGRPESTFPQIIL